MSEAEIPPVITVTEVGGPEWALWRALRLHALADSPAAFRSTLEEWSGPGDTEQRWRARLDSVLLNVVLALSGMPSAMVSATAPNEDGEILLISMWVAPHARGHGVGDAALIHATAWARRQPGFHRLMLTVAIDNVPAIALYKRHNFVDAGQVEGHPDERWMLQTG